MKKRILGRTGLEVSVVGLGGIPLQGIDPAAAARVVEEALSAGIDFVDTARGYTDSEEKIGRALEGRRDAVAIASKAMSRSAGGMRRELEESLRDLRTDRIDLYQLHAVSSGDQLDRALGPEGAFEALDRARDRGEVRFIGVTGHVPELILKAIETGLFDTVQIPLNPLETRWIEAVVPAARERSIGVIGMKPLAGGALRNAPAALRFALGRGADVVIPGMDSPDQVRQNAGAVEAGLEPTAEDLTALEEEGRAWVGHFCRRCGYCKPCPNGLEIPLLLLIEAYYTRYGLRDWALERLATLDKGYADCTACGECTTRCPYELPVAELMAEAAEKVR